LFFVYQFSQLSAQDLTVIKGRVFDATTKDPMPFVDLILKDTYVGASTDLDGRYRIETKNPSDSIICNFIGYKAVTLPIEKEARQTINFYLEQEGVSIEAVTITEKKGRYRKKNNPAVDLMRNVIDNRDRNRLESQEHYNYDKHEILELDLNNITEEFKQKKTFKNFDFLWNYLDTSDVNGRVYLPLYIREILSSVHYRKDPESKKEIREAIKMTEFDEALDMESITNVIDLLYQDVNLYENNISLLDNEFLSPMAPWALNYYRFYILDTTFVNQKEAIHLAFIPRNKTFIGFTGDVYISNDGRYTLLKAILGITKDISMNFVRDIKIVQEFQEIDSVYALSRDEITLDASLSSGGMGIYASRDNIYRNYNFEPHEDPSVFDNIEDVVIKDEAYELDNDYWQDKRLLKLTSEEQGIYDMIDTLQSVPAYKRFVYLTKIVTTGYIPAGALDIGKLGTMVSFNQVEGLRLRVGPETSHSLTQKIQARTYAAYGFRDKRFKYGASFLYSLTDDYRENPRKFIEATYRNDVFIPGLELEFLSADNFLTSFRRGEANQMLFVEEFDIDLYLENDVGFLKFGLNNKRREPYGTLTFEAMRDDMNVNIADVQTTEFNFSAEFSPNTAFIQGREVRTPIKSENPRFQLSYKGGIKGIGGDYAYHNVSFQIKKRINMSIVGRMETEVEVGRVWGDNLPFVLLYIPTANQSYSFNPISFNTMNFLEFATDKYARFYMQHFFDGFIFNRIPLWRKLKLKEVISFKTVYGGLDDDNDPNLNPELIQFNRLSNGQFLTTAFKEKVPFMEYGIGVYNIFRFFRIDAVKRINYLDRPNVESLFGVKGLGLRARVKVEF
jgi:hypothetical protein